MTSGVISLVLIPGIGTPPVKEWTIVEQEKDNSALEFLTFEHQLPLTSAFVWPKLLELGLPLTEQLVALQAKNKVSDLAQFIICYSSISS